MKFKKFTHKIIFAFSLATLPLSSFFAQNQMDLPVTFELATTDYGLAGFGGAELSTIEVDPTDPTNTVAKVIKSNTAATWAGTTITDVGNLGFATPIPFVSGATSMSLRVWSPDAGIQIRMKVEDHTNAGISVETEATTTVAGQWETLTFNFANQAAGTATINLANNYDKASVFFNFGVDGATAGTKTYYFDDLTYVSGGGLNQMDLPVTFELANTDYGLAGFGGAELSTIEVDPTDPTNTVAKVIKSNTAATWAGTTITNASNSGLASPIPFASGATSMSLKVWSPDAGIQVRLKVEDYTNPGITVETEATTTAAGQWQTLTFDFANQAAGTAAINLANNYNKASVFFNFGVDGATAGTKTYYFDNLSMAAGASGLNLNIDVCNVNATSVRITGPWWNWDPNGGPIATDNGDGTWTVNLNPTPTADMEYLVVVNSVQENLISDMQNGGTCAPVTDYSNYANRKWVVGSGDVNINYDRCVPCEYPDLVITTEICDSADQVNLTGPIWQWNPAFGPQAVDNGDGTWTFTISPAPTDSLEYLLVKDGVMENLISEMQNGGGCAPLTDYSSYANRQWILGQGDVSNTYDRCSPCALGVEEFSQMDVAIYPNPTNALITLTSSKAIEKIEVYSLVGELVLSTETNKFVVELDITSLEAGLYTVNVHGANGIQTARIVKN